MILIGFFPDAVLPDLRGNEGMVALAMEANGRRGREVGKAGAQVRFRFTRGLEDAFDARGDDTTGLAVG